MKICIINNIYPPYHRGGAEQVVVQTVRGLRERGHEVVVITSTPDENEVVHEDGVVVYRINPRNSYFYTDAHHHSVMARVRWHIENIWNRYVADHVDRIIQDESPDVVHTHNLIGLSFLIPQRIQKRGIRHIHTVHDVQLVEPSAMILKTKENSFRYRGPHTVLYSFVTRRLLGSPDVVISPSGFLLDFYTKRGFFSHSHRIVVRNPLTFSAEPAHNHELSNTFTILYVGQIEYHKGITILLDAFDSFISRDPDTHVVLHIAGSGSKLDDVRARARTNSRIHVHGRVEKQMLRTLYRSADIVAVPSLCYENSPTVIFESFSFHVPVLASRIEGIAELIEEKENGITFTAGDTIELADKIAWCVSHQAELVAMRRHISVPSSSNEAYIHALEESYCGN